jgi:hypothetical protein
MSEALPLVPCSWFDATQRRKFLLLPFSSNAKVSIVTRLRARQFGILSLAGARDFYPFQTCQIALGLHSAFCLNGDVVLLLGRM